MDADMSDIHRHNLTAAHVDKHITSITIVSVIRHDGEKY